MTDPHPDSAYAALLSLREWIPMMCETLHDVVLEIDRRLATADRGEVKPERDDGVLQRFLENYHPLHAVEPERVLYELCRRALEGGQP